MTQSGTTTPYAKVCISAYMVPEVSARYQHYEPWLLREQDHQTCETWAAKAGCETNKRLMSTEK